MSPKSRHGLPHWLEEMPIRLLVVGTSAVFALGTFLAIVMPAYQMASIAPAGNAHPYTAVENRGRFVYFTEGCWYCHTQQVRPVATDRALGAVMMSGDYYYDVPQPMGTERTGPDLMHVGGRIPSYLWLKDHLITPQKEVPGTVMPSFGYLSHKDMDALVRYLLSLK